jgi:cysteinyl-tRNA synthetase
MVKLNLFNTLSGSKEEFIPVDEKHVRIYTCGPTVYNYAHIGNARPAVISDLLVRFLRVLYPKVTYVSNITDIDDKIIKASDDLGVPISDLTKKYEKIYNEDMSSLNIISPDIQPHATDHIPEMIELILKNIRNGRAYESEGHVLFDVSSYKGYGKLSGRNQEDQLAGSRVEIATYKKNPGDFVLWKPSTGTQPGWESPWGYGRPGWHLECSAMSEKSLGLPFDIHGGGMDLIFPHHENEIAQSCGAYNENENPRLYVKYWLHNALLNMDGEKMSKSLNNIFYIRDLLEDYDGEVLRFTLLSSHYRQSLNFSSKALISSKKILDRFYRALNSCEDINISENVKLIDFTPTSILEALGDDLNTSKVFAEMNKISKELSIETVAENKIQLKKKLLASGMIVGLLQKKPSDWLGINVSKDDLDSKFIEKLIRERQVARNQKDFTKADQIRDKLKKNGIEIEDTSDGTIWRSIKK